MYGKSQGELNAEPRWLLGGIKAGSDLGAGRPGGDDWQPAGAQGLPERGRGHQTGGLL